MAIRNYSFFDKTFFNTKPQIECIRKCYGRGRESREIKIEKRDKAGRRVGGGREITYCFFLTGGN